MLACWISPIVLLAFVFNSWTAYGAFFDESFPLHAEQAPHTFIFLVNGTVRHSSVDTHGSSNLKIVDRDQEEVQEIVNLAPSCLSCNIVLLHMRPENSNSKHRLLVFSKGVLLLESFYNKLNASDPDTFGRLLKKVHEWFPTGDHHLIYRGHGFYPNSDLLDKALIQTSPFDGNYPATAYTIETFARSLDQAGYKQKKLASLTFATCSMAYGEVAKNFAPYSKTLIAPQLSVFENKGGGFYYGFLSQIPWHLEKREAIEKLITKNLLLNFVTSLPGPVNCMESPISVIALSEWETLWKNFLDLTIIWKKQCISSEGHVNALCLDASVFKYPSVRQIQSLQDKGKTPEQIKAFISIMRSPSEYPYERDMGLFLNSIDKEHLDDSSLQLLTKTQDMLKSFVIRRSCFPDSHRSGVSFDFLAVL